MEILHLDYYNMDSILCSGNLYLLLCLNWNMKKMIVFKLFNNCSVCEKSLFYQLNISINTLVIVILADKKRLSLFVLLSNVLSNKKYLEFGSTCQYLHFGLIWQLPLISWPKILSNLFSLSASLTDREK